MNKLYFLTLILVFLSCNTKDPKFIRKKIENKDVKITWFYHSYLTNNSPDFVVVEKDGNIKEIYKADGVVVDVLLKEHDIILKLFAPSKGIVFTKQVEKEVYGYNIILDSTAPYEAFGLRPDGVKENN